MENNLASSANGLAPSNPCARPTTPGRPRHANAQSNPPTPPTNRSSSTLHPALCFPNFIKTLNSGAWAGLGPLSPSSPFPTSNRLPAFTLVVVVGLGLHPIPSLCLSKAASNRRYFFSDPSPFSRFDPSSASDPIRFDSNSLHSVFFPSSSLLPPTSSSLQPAPPPSPIILILLGMTPRRSATYQIRPPPKEVFPESTLSPGGLQLTTLFWDIEILFHQGSHAGARVGNNFEVFGCIMTRVFFSPL